ncbi:hypothetical protein [Paractinoplanes durhamensis]|uniref:Uncharacterized protein n=1 Tax=Paractinoplanes durhamensis TaxID=113563 RepID=A0ABQ3Z0W4_9ACTN|nr:hypothetical protein [Actinoplanes durhamensis]GIE03415.1 hypothetical protein Adu01nite_47650 [Actinoplanes durhamensis]
MGADTFTHYQAGADAETAFVQARKEALHQHGHGGYSGTLAEKDTFLVITDQPMSAQAAKALAGELIERNDPRIEDKRGPAGAIASRSQPAS